MFTVNCPGHGGRTLIWPSGIDAINYEAFMQVFAASVAWRGVVCAVGACAGGGDGLSEGTDTPHARWWSHCVAGVCGLRRVGWRQREEVGSGGRQTEGHTARDTRTSPWTTWWRRSCRWAATPRFERPSPPTPPRSPDTRRRKRERADGRTPHDCTRATPARRPPFLPPHALPSVSAHDLAAASLPPPRHLRPPQSARPSRRGASGV